MPKVAVKVCFLGAVFLAIALLAWDSGLRLNELIQFNSFAGVFGVAILTSFYHLGFYTTIAGLANSLFAVEIKSSDRIDLKEFNYSAATWIMYSANLVAIVAMIDVMGNLADPSKLGEAVARAFFAYFYGAIGVLVVSGPGSSTRAKESRVGPGSALLSGFAVLVIFVGVLFALKSIPPR